MKKILDQLKILTFWEEREREEKQRPDEIHWLEKAKDKFEEMGFVFRDVIDSKE